MNNHDLSQARIRQVAVNASQLDRAVEFYRDTLGIPFLFEAPGLAFFQCGEVRLMLSRPERPEFNHPSSALYYGVNDIAASWEALGSRGVKFEGPPQVVHRTDTYELWLALFRDSEGNPLLLMEERSIA